mmetsp:Transcript_68300/g.188990  ORF Transcript_68300/g.188990 Transcript_68300/m.188990 type:complete len:241 (+) Transcript_68300:259-981(+)
MFGRCGELLAFAVLEDHRLEAVIHLGVHHWAVPVALNVSSQTLVRRAPGHLAHLAAPKRPIAEASEMIPQSQGVFVLFHVNESVSQTPGAFEVRGQVDEIVLRAEPRCLKQAEEHVPCVVGGQVPHDDSGPASLVPVSVVAGAAADNFRLAGPTHGAMCFCNTQPGVSLLHGKSSRVVFTTIPRAHVTPSRLWPEGRWHHHHRGGTVHRHRGHCRGGRPMAPQLILECRLSFMHVQTAAL